VKVVVLTTSYPRFDGDAAGGFVADAVEAVRARGVDVRVVSPQDFPHFGIAYGSGIAGNLRAAPWRAALVPPMLGAFARAARRAARDADVVHAHWLSAGVAALATGKPYVLQLWGTDVELARRAPRLFRPVVRRAALAICASSALAEEARRLGAGEVRVIPSSVRVAEHVAEPDEPPHVLYAGRLSPEKGILEFVSATDGVSRVIAGDGPLRDQVPGALGMVPRSELGGYYERAAVVCIPSLREGFGMTCLEAMAHGRPVVASATGGLLDLVEDGETGLLVPPGDVAALRSAIERLLADVELRGRLGRGARERVREHFSQQATAAELIRAYGDAARRSIPN
jgi:glycosyltransferase involved in cell wall biosynthesis